MTSVTTGGSAAKASLSGIVSGSVSCLLLQPLDLLKTRLQQAPKAKSAVFPIARDIVAKGGVPALWTGLGPSLLRLVPGTGIYFFSLQSLQNAFIPTGQKPSGTENFALGFVSRTIGTVLLVPATVVKIRTESSQYAYTSIVHGFRDTVAKDGFRALWSGCLATVIRDGPFSGLYLAMYRFLLSFLPPNDTNAVRLERFGCALTAGLGATALTHPFDVVKTRVQLRPKENPTLFPALYRIRAEEGFRGLYQGFGVRALRRSLLLALTWSVFHEVTKAVGL